MGFFDFLKDKKKATPNISINFCETINGKTVRTSPQNNSEELPTDFEHLTVEGELPFGWIYRNKNFVDKINKEYSYFLDEWLDSINKSPKEQYSALKSFVLYLEDVEKLCKSKGECFEFWFNEILTSPGYLDERKKELEELTANLEEITL